VCLKLQKVDKGDDPRHKTPKLRRQHFNVFQTSRNFNGKLSYGTEKQFSLSRPSFYAECGSASDSYAISGRVHFIDILFFSSFLNKYTSAWEVHGMSNSVVAVDTEGDKDISAAVGDHSLEESNELASHISRIPRHCQSPDDVR